MQQSSLTTAKINLNLSNLSICASRAGSGCTECSESADAVEAEAFAQRYPEVNVAMLDAIRKAKLEADGWVSLSNHASNSLSANIELIEATE